MKRFNNFKSQPMVNSRDRIQDLDRELELLRRKRQIIEEQQFHQSSASSSYISPHNINPWQQPARNDYNQGQSSFGQPAYADLYDSQGVASNTFDRPTRNRRKRQSGGSGPQWQDDPSAKRFRGQQGDRPLTDSRPFKAPNQFGSKAPPTFKPPQKRFPDASNAKKPFMGPNPLAGQAPKPSPAAVPKKKGKAAKAPAAQNPAKAGGKASSRVKLKLTDKLKPPKKLIGRLEYSLGVLFLKMKSRHSNEPYAHIFDCVNQNELVKVVKKAIRTRIREALYMKEVSDITEIITAYEAVYPDSADKEIIDEVLSAQAWMQELANSAQDSAYLKDIVNETEFSKLYFKQNMTSVLQLTLTEMFAKLEKIYKDEVNSNELTRMMVEADNGHRRKNLNANTEEESATAEPTTDSNNSQDTAAKTELSGSDNATEAVADKDTAQNVSEPTVERYKKLLQDLVKEELLKLLPTFKNEIIDIMELDLEYLKARLYVHNRTALLKKNENAVGKVGLYFVMVMGQPQLPNRSQLQRFLHKFRPNTVKKHRTVPNVLYIGFTDKANFDEILKCDDKVVAGMRLTIKESKAFKLNAADGDSTAENVTQEVETVTQAVENDSNEMNADSQELKNNTEYVDDVIDSDIDGQINDLLNNIKQQEENMDEGTTINNDNVSSVNDDSIQIIDDKTEVINLDEEFESNETVNDEKLIKNTEETVKNTEETAKNAEETARNAEETARNGEETAKNAEETARNAEETARNGEETAKNAEETAKNAEETAKNSEETVNNGEVSKNGEAAPMYADEKTKNVQEDKAAVTASKVTDSAPKAQSPVNTRRSSRLKN